jgi:glutamate racemase
MVLKNKYSKIYTLLLLIPVVLIFFVSSLSGGDMDDLSFLSKKDNVKILVTDSGLGGLSVCGELENKLETGKKFSNVEIVFCNAIPETNFGYNNIESIEEKGLIFSDVLEGMVGWYKPDIILIACNTLSVVYPYTKFSSSTKIPVIGIVELGARMIAEKLESDTTSVGIVFGTETTISSEAHRSLLRGMGINDDRIITQSCPELAGEIQSDATSDMVKNMIEMYVSEAIEKISRGKQHGVVVGLCCTHYGYCKDQFSKSFASNGYKSVEIVNPNDNMAEIVINAQPYKDIKSTSVKVSVISRALISNDEINSTSILLKKFPKTSAALKKYERKTDLFKFIR